ncbi:BnaC04g02560D [Brassica napus]|uniref:BnaC04g02560D protein n=1 Tax=Brassica napus TaxID=3708 RepID=A0A078IR11_BRANA|nr:BnaC04g02560D [Brassica napus]
MLTLRLKLEFLLVINHLRAHLFDKWCGVLIELLLDRIKWRGVLIELDICLLGQLGVWFGHKEEISLVDVLNMKLQNTGSS